MNTLHWTHVTNIPTHTPNPETPIPQNVNKLLAFEMASWASLANKSAPVSFHKSFFIGPSKSSDRPDA